MKPESDEYEVAPISMNDSRVTGIGRFLRRTSLDELPQLFNVLRGDMSLVGPRPEMPFIVDKYTSWQRHRLDVKPGLTGMWQIMGRKELPLHDNLGYDYYYIRNQSLMLDFTILLRTIAIIFRGRGAY
jgi:lipopolysaccharide/colanic/teichoic acid biosynthesis glycosyltransferase